MGFWVGMGNGVVWFLGSVGGVGLVWVFEEEEFVWLARVGKDEKVEILSL